MRYSSIINLEMSYKDINKKRAAELRWYYKNKEKVRSSRAKRRQERLKFIRQLKDKPCTDCGIRYPSYVMDFDHREKVYKVNTINRMAGTGYGWVTVLAEIEKCDVVCANCHRIRTYKRLHQENSTLITIRKINHNVKEV